MKWSLTLGRLAGIQVRVHVTFVLILIWVAWQQLKSNATPLTVALSLAFVLLIFSFVVLHELGHALTARRFGIETHDIVLLPIGGVARLKSMPTEPRQEFAVAIAGPLVNVVLASVFFAIALLAGIEPSAIDASKPWTLSSFAYSMISVNLILFAFNLLPAFPMDGGRILRAVLASKLDRAKATQIAAFIGQGLALALSFAGLLVGNPFLMFIGLFIWIGAGQEARFATLKAQLAGVSATEVMLTDFHTLKPSDSLDRALQETTAGSQTDFPVLDGGRLVGMLSQQRMLRAVAEGGPDQLIESVMEDAPTPVEPDASMDLVVDDLEFLKRGIVPVTKSGWLEGLVTRENLAEFIAIRSALKKAESRIQESTSGDPEDRKKETVKTRQPVAQGASGKGILSTATTSSVPKQ